MPQTTDIVETVARLAILTRDLAKVVADIEARLKAVEKSLGINRDPSPPYDDV